MASYPSTATLPPGLLVRVTCLAKSWFTSGEAAAGAVFDGLASRTSAYAASQPTTPQGSWAAGYTFVIDAKITSAVTVRDFKAQIAQLGVEAVDVATATGTATARDTATASAAASVAANTWYTKALSTFRSARAWLVVAVILGLIVYTAPWWRALLPKPGRTAPA